MNNSETNRYPPNQITALLEDIHNVDCSTLSPTQKRELLKETLQYNTYSVQQRRETPTPNPCDTQHTHINPAVEDYCRHHTWTSDGWSHDNGTVALTTYPEYVPTDNAITTITAYDPVIEIGAGNGYWAYVLDNTGCDIHATDKSPVNGSVKTTFTKYERAQSLHRTELTGETHTIEHNENTLYEVKRRNWFDVSAATHDTIATTTDTVLLCHPPADTWTEELLEHISPSQHLIYVGQWYPGSDATPYFHYELTNWELIETFPVYDWDTQHAHGYVFTPPNKNKSTNKQ